MFLFLFLYFIRRRVPIKILCKKDLLRWCWLVQVKVSELEGKVVGLLFAANWYPPCRVFTQLLIGIYEELKTNNPHFEIVYVSSDEDLDAFNEFYKNMPWLAIPFYDLETKKSLNRKYEVEGIPCLIMLQPSKVDDATTLRHGVELIYRYGVQAYPFSNERLMELHEAEREKRENQTLINLLANNFRDYVLSQTHTGLFTQVINILHATVFFHYYYYLKIDIINFWFDWSCTGTYCFFSG